MTPRGRSLRRALFKGGWAEPHLVLATHHGYRHARGLVQPARREGARVSRRRAGASLGRCGSELGTRHNARAPRRQTHRTLPTAARFAARDMSSVRVLVGTRKGAFVLESDGKRKDWKINGPHFGGWEIYHLKGSPADPNRIYASQSRAGSGRSCSAPTTAVARGSRSAIDFVYDGAPGTHHWYDGTPHPWEFARVWHFEPSLHRSRHGLCRRRRCRALSLDRRRAELARARGAAQAPIGARRGSPAPAACACTRSPRSARSAAHLCRDLGRRRLSQRRRAARPGSRSTAGCTPTAFPTRRPRSATACIASRCTRAIRTSSSCRSTGTSCAATTRGDSWREVSGNLPTDFGFCDRRPRARAADDLRRPDQERLGAFPARRAAARLPQPHRRRRVGAAHARDCRSKHCYVNVLRDAMAVDTLDSCGIYFGTTGGQVYASPDAGDTWAPIVRDLPGGPLRRGADAPVIRVVLPAHLRALARVGGEVSLEVAGDVTQRSVLDALESRYPVLRGTIRDHVTQQTPRRTCASLPASATSRTNRPTRRCRRPSRAARSRFSSSARWRAARGRSRVCGASPPLERSHRTGLRRGRRRRRRRCATF